MKLKQKRTLSVRTARSANADECTGSAFDPSDVALWWDPNMIRSNSAAIYVPVGNFPGWASEIGKKVHNMGWTIPGCILQDQGVILRVNALVVGPRDAYMLLISKYIETPPWEGAAQTSTLHRFTGMAGDGSRINYFLYYLWGFIVLFRRLKDINPTKPTPNKILN